MTTPSFSSVADVTLDQTAIVTMTDGATREIAANLDVSNYDTQYVGPQQANPNNASLPDLHGSGQLADLQVVMGADPTLTALVQTLVATSILNNGSLDAAVEGVLYDRPAALLILLGFASERRSQRRAVGPAGAEQAGHAEGGGARYAGRAQRLEIALVGEVVHPERQVITAGRKAGANARVHE